MDAFSQLTGSLVTSKRELGHEFMSAKTMEGMKPFEVQLR